MKTQRRIVNRAFEVPGPFAVTKAVHLASGAGRARVSIGMANAATGKLAPIALCKGAIPIEYPRELPWTGEKPFMPGGVHVLIDSFQFDTNIGRNVVFRDTAFFRELTTLLFSRLVLEHFAPVMAQHFTRARHLSANDRREFQRLFGDLCHLSTEHGFAIPQAVLDAPFVPGLSGERYSVAQLSAGSGPVYCTWERPDPVELMLDRSHAEPDDPAAPSVPIVSLADLPGGFRGFLERRLGSRLTELRERVVVSGENDAELRALSEFLRELLSHGRFASPFESLLSLLSGESDAAPLGLRLRFARFHQVDGAEDRRTRTLYRKDGNEVLLNRCHPHIDNLLDLLQDPGRRHTAVAAHFLLREALYDPRLEISMPARERSLVRDLGRFMSADDGAAPDLGLEFSRRLGAGDDFELAPA